MLQFRISLRLKGAPAGLPVTALLSDATGSQPASAGGWGGTNPAQGAVTEARLRLTGPLDEPLLMLAAPWPLPTTGWEVPLPEADLLRLTIELSAPLAPGLTRTYGLATPFQANQTLLLRKNGGWERLPAAGLVTAGTLAWSSGPVTDSYDAWGRYDAQGRLLGGGPLSPLTQTGTDTYTPGPLRTLAADSHLVACAPGLRRELAQATLRAVLSAEDDYLSRLALAWARFDALDTQGGAMQPAEAASVLAGIRGLLAGAGREAHG